MSENSNAVDSAVAAGDLDRLHAKMKVIRGADDVPRSHVSNNQQRLPTNEPQASVEEEEDFPDQDVLRLYPKSPEARRAFDSVVQLKHAGRLSDIHAQSLVVNSEDLLKQPVDVNQRPPEETIPEPSSDNEDNRRIVFHGYLRIRFRLPVTSQGARWVC